MIAAVSRPMQFDLELVGVSKHFGDVCAVKDVNLQVRKGEFLSIIGPSGCGKTTTLRMIAGFERPSAGEIYLEGCLVNPNPPYRRNVNTVFQHYALFPHMTVYENIAFGLRIHTRDEHIIRDSVRRMLATVELVGYEKRYPDQLSGGEQQRVALARALVKEPAVLLLDEPLGSLDLKVRKRMQIELKRIHTQVGITFIYVTHDQEEALVMSDRVAVMNQGRIEQIDTTTELYESPKTRYVSDFVGESNAFRGVITSLGRDRAEILTEGRLLITVGPSDLFELNQTVDVVVRPEKIRLGETRPPDPENVFEGEVQDSVFQGINIKYFVALPGNVSLAVYRPNQSVLARGALYPPGTKVYVSWDRESNLVFGSE
jgi:spermidine/putrescine transport system ATP-binding protein